MAESDSFIMGRLVKDLESGQLDQITAKAYLEQNVFGMLEQSLNLLLEKIEENGEFEKYVEMLAARQEKEQRDLRRRAREMKRLELGDDYVSSESEGSVEESDPEETYGDESAAEMMSPGDATSPLTREDGSPGIGEGLRSEVDATSTVREAFNPLRFIAMSLKELKSQQQ